MSQNKNKQKFTTGIAKWFQRLILVVILLYIFETLVIRVDVRQKVLIILRNKSSTIKEIRIFMRNYLPVTAIKNTSNNGNVLEKGFESKYFIQENQTLVNSSERLFVNQSKVNISTVERLLANTVALGGKFTPTKYSSEQKIAMVIPYRDREEHLNIFLRHMHPFLQRQQLDYRIFVIEMDKGITFNRAILMNIGFVEALKLQNFTCFIFHDVDLLPEYDMIPYACADMPRHLSVAVDKFKYRLPYRTIFGGASSINTDHFLKVNGMSNMFFGWGGEDDDFSRRIRLNDLKIVRPSKDIARYTMIVHKKDTNKNNQRLCLLESTKQRMKIDGLSNLKYNVTKVKVQPLFTSILVRVDGQKILASDDNLSKIYKNCKERSKKSNNQK